MSSGPHAMKHPPSWSLLSLFLLAVPVAAEEAPDHPSTDRLFAQEAIAWLGLQPGTVGGGAVANLHGAMAAGSLRMTGMQVRASLPLCKLAPSKLVPSLCLLH